MVVQIFGALAGLVKIELSKTQIDNAIFKLHYKWTTGFCFIACALVASFDLMGSGIQCTEKDKTITSYCWITSTYTINSTDGGIPGIGLYDPRKHEKRFHSYYQWVPLVLFLQGCLFYCPHLIWKTVEGNRMDTIASGLNEIVYDEVDKGKTKNVVKYLKETRGYHQLYFYGYFTSEILNFVNVFAQMFLMDLFFGGMFLHLGREVLFLLAVNDTTRSDALIERFPRITKCTFRSYGFSGTLEIKDILCILPQNLLNEKIFLIMWVWFAFLIICSFLQVIFRLLVAFLPGLRLRLMQRRGKLEPSCEVDELVRKINIGDFFLLYTISKNINCAIFKDILHQLIYDDDGDSDLLSPHALIMDTYKPFNVGIDDDLMEMQRRRV